MIVNTNFNNLTLSSDEVKERIMEAARRDLFPIAQQLIDLKAKKTLAEQRLEEAQRNIQKAQQGQIEGRQMQVEGRQMQAEGQQGMRNTLVTLFHRLFHGNKQEVPAEQVNALFSKYLADESISFEKEKRCFKLNSMKGVVSYLKDHSNVTQCDFRCFKTEINDIPTLAEYLKESKVKAIALNNGISEEAKHNMAQAVSTRAQANFPLKVQYFA